MDKFKIKQALLYRLTTQNQPLTRFCKPHPSATKSVSPEGRDGLRRCAFALAEGERNSSRHSELVSESLTVADYNNYEVALTGQTGPVTLNSFQGLLPLNVNDNREINSPTGQTNIDSVGRLYQADKIDPSPQPSPVGRGGNRRCAFTLAEVLITLGIIGIVAAMTLPTLIHKYQAKVFETRFKKSVAVITEIINRTRYDMGIENLGEYCAYLNSGTYPNAAECMLNINNNIITLAKPTTSWDKSRYYNIQRSKADIYTYNGKNNITSSSLEYAIFYTNELKDGTFLGYNVSGGSSFFAVDLNGYGKPNRLGHDIFIFSVTKDVNSKLTSNYDRKPNNNLTDEQATQKWENSDNANKAYNMAIEGMPCNKTSTRAGNGLGCAYYALRNICPDDSTKTYWECLPK